MAEIIRTLGALLGREVETVRRPAQPGDVRDTAADITVARHAFGYAPTVPMADGLARMLEAEMTLVPRRQLTEVGKHGVA